jgi:hypothetical protein
MGDREATTHKENGNAKFKAKDYETAIEDFSCGIDCCPKDGSSEVLHVLYSNRAAAQQLFTQGKWGKAKGEEFGRGMEAVTLRELVL